MSEGSAKAGADLDIEDPEQLLAYLRSRGWDLGAGTPEIRVLAGGVSNRTVLVRGGGRDIVLKQALAKLRVATDWFSPPERIHREALGLRWLARLESPETVPAFLFEDFERHVLAMEAVPEPSANWKTELLAGRIAAGHFIQCGRLLGELQVLGRSNPEVRTDFADASFFESLRLEPYYLFAASQAPEAAGFMHALAEETRARRTGLVHGDYSPKNFLIHDGRLRLLDHEVIHWGEPAFDLGFVLTHFLSKARHMPGRARELRAGIDAFLGAFREAAAPLPADWEERGVAHTLGCLLARVAGRSPLEYLAPAARRRQRDFATAMMRHPPHRLDDLVGPFLADAAP